MSYGIWRKSGRGWSTIEIDTPGNRGERLFDLKFDSPVSFRILHSQLRSSSLRWSEDDDYHYLRWRIGQEKKRRKVVNFCPGGGEHIIWIAYETEVALQEALRKTHPEYEKLFFDENGSRRTIQESEQHPEYKTFYGLQED